jgi:hypothetical protein
VAPRRQGRPTEAEALSVAKGPLIDELVAACATARNGLERPARERDRQIEDAFFRAAAALETFLSEWLVRCVSFDAGHFRATFEQRAANWATAQLNNGFEPRDRLWKRRDADVAVTVHLPILKKQSLEESRALLGAENDNVSIRSISDLIQLADAYLAEKYARRPRQLGGERATILDATISMRNVLAHRSHALPTP